MIASIPTGLDYSVSAFLDERKMIQSIAMLFSGPVSVISS